MYYFFIEKNLFLTYTETDYKYNLIAYQSYSDSQEAVYFNVTLNIDELFNPYKNGYKNITHWNIYKPGTVIRSEFLKKSKGKYITIYFKQEWIEKFMTNNCPEKLDFFYEFLHSSSNLIKFTSSELKHKNLVTNLQSAILTENNSENKVLINEYAKAFVQVFLEEFTDNIKSKKYLELNDKDRAIVLYVEQILTENIYEKFIGLESLANYVGCSATKLKTTFKQVHQTSILQYFQKLQMERAKDLIQNSTLKIGDISAKFNYENGSKFSATFKEFTGYLPSELRKKE
jgi:AraC-like DNA-binding protein